MQRVIHDGQEEQEHESHWVAWTAAGILGAAALAGAGYAAWRLTRPATRRERLMEKAEHALMMIRR